MAVFEHGEHDIHYTLEGDPKKPVLVILNGIMMSTLSWEPFKEAFLKDVRLLRLDLLDQGRSSKMSGNYDQTVQVDMLEALFTALDLQEMTLAGISYGGNVALQYAAKHPERLDGLVVFNAVEKTTDWLKAIGRGWNEVAKTRNAEAYYHVTIPMIYSPHFYNDNPQWMAARKEKVLPVFADPAFLDAMSRLTTSAESHDVSETLRNIEVPTLVVASEHDYLTPPFEQTRIVEKMPNARLVTFNGCGHASMYEKPDLFVSTIIGFIQENHRTYDI